MVTENLTKDKIDLSKLPQDELDQLHEIAERKGLTELEEKIEDETFRRLEKEIMTRDKSMK